MCASLDSGSVNRPKAVVRQDAASRGTVAITCSVAYKPRAHTLWSVRDSHEVVPIPLAVTQEAAPAVHETSAATFEYESLLMPIEF